ncbi:WXG100-like domain-containing protein, partial [Saccharopolyspora phatthalungensis]
MVPEGVRRLFQVLTGEDMTDADEDALFAVAERLESGAVAVEVLGPVVGEVVGRVRGGFSGKAADRFAERLGAFGPVLESGGVGLRELAGFVRNLAVQVQYLKFVTVGGLLLLVAEIAWAVAMAGPTGGASMAWLAARFAVMRLLLTRWWGQLFMRLAMSQVVGVGLQVVMDAGAQGLQFALGTREKWDAAMSEMAVGVGSFSGLLAVPLSALGNVVGNAISKVLVRGLGDKIDVEVLAAAAKHAAEEHAERYPVSSVARFADVVSKDIDDFTGMSVRAMWAVRFGHGLGEAFEEGLTEMLGEAGYGAISGQGAQWNPFSFTAGVSEAIGSGVGNIAGLALRGELLPAGRARDAWEKDSGSAEKQTEAETFEESRADSGSQTGEKPGLAEINGLPEAYREKPGYLTETSDVNNDIPATPSVPRDVHAGAAAGQDAKTAVPEQDIAAVSRDGDESTVSGALRGHDRPGTPPPPYSLPQGASLSRGDSRGSDGTAGVGDSRAGMPPPAYSPDTGDGRADVAPSGVDNAAGYRNGPLAADGGVTAGASRADSPQRDGLGTAGIAEYRGDRSPSDGAGPAGSPRAGAPPVHNSVAGGDHASVLPSAADGSEARSASEPAPGSPSPGDPADRSAALVDSRPDSSAYDDHSAELSQVDSVRMGDGAPQSPVLPDTSVLPESSGAVSSGGVVPGPVGLPAGAVRVSVPAGVASGAGIAEFVRGQVGDAGTGPVVLVPGEGAGPGVVSSRQASEVARGLERDVVALMPERGRRGPEWMRFAADGSRPRPFGALGQLQGPQQTSARAGLGGLASSSTAVPERETVVAGSAEASSAATSSAGMQSHAEERPASAFVAGSSEEDLRRQVEWARSVGGPRAVAVGIVQGTHDVVALARGDAGVSLDDVVALVAARAGEMGRDGAVRFSRELADRLGTRGSGLGVRAGAGSLSESRGRKRGRDDGSVDDGAARRPLGPRDFTITPEFSVTNASDSGLSLGPGGARVDSAPVAVDAAGAAYGEYGESVNEAGRQEARRARDAGKPYSGPALGRKFGKSRQWGYTRLTEIRDDGGLTERQGASDSGLSVGPNDVRVDPAPVEADAAGAPNGEWESVNAASVNEAARQEARRARDAGEPYSGPALGRKFGKSRQWGYARLLEIRDESGLTEHEMRRQEQEWSREEVLAEARRARDAGEPYTGDSLAEKFGMSRRWGWARLEEIKGEGGVTRSVMQAQEAERLREEARAEARRASATGEPYTGATLGKKFGMSASWGQHRLAEISDEVELIGRVLAAQGQKHEREREEARVEARRARDAGEPCTGATLGKKFGKSGAWGRARLAEINDAGGATRRADWALAQEAARVEARRARDAGEPYSAATLGAKFGKSDAWGAHRLVEISAETRAKSGAGQRVSRRREWERERAAARVEVRRARDAGEPYSGATLGKKFGKSTSWGSRLLAEMRDEGDATRLSSPTQETDSRSAVPLIEAPASNGQVGGTAADPADDLVLWGFDPAVDAELGPAVEDWSWPDVFGADDAGLFAFDADFDMNAVDLGFGGMDSVDESVGRRPSGPQDFANLPGVWGDGAAVGGLPGVEPWSSGHAGVPGGGVPDLAASGGYLDPSAAKVSEGSVPAQSVSPVDLTGRSHSGVSQSGVESKGVAGWTESHLCMEVEWARLVGGPRDVAVRVVQGTHDVVALAREDADVSLDDVVTLVAAKVNEVGRGEAV